MNTTNNHMNARTRKLEPVTFKAITRTELYEKINGCARRIHADMFIQHMIITGIIASTEDNRYVLTDRFDDCLKRAAKPFTRGDIVFTMGNGFLLVLDTKPAAAPDGEHFRGMRVSMTTDGAWRIEVKLRSQIYDNYMTLGFAKSAFNMDEIEQYSYDRYLAYDKIQKIDLALTDMRG